MRPDLKYICDEWIKRGKALGYTREIDSSGCLFTPGELILVISQIKQHPLHEELQPVSVLRVFHTTSQHGKYINSNEDIFRLRMLFDGLEEDFEFLYDRIAAQCHINYRKGSN